MIMIQKIIDCGKQTEFRRYFCAGSLVFLTDFMVLVLLTEMFGVNYLLSNLVAVTIGLLMSYVLSIKWIFLDRRYKSISLEFPIFVLTCVVGLILNEFLLWSFVEFGEIDYLVAKIIVTAAVFVVNFGLKKFILFRK